MKATLYLSLEEILDLHAELIRRFGGETGLRDRGLLESALFRPRSGYYKSLPEQAAALMHSLVLGHAFIDGNKRVAFAATAIFLRMNGYRLDVNADETESFIIENIIKDKIGVDEISSWIERAIRKIN